MAAEQIHVEIAANDSVTALAYPAAKPRRADVTLILGHGAGAGQKSPFMVNFATALAARGIDTVTFDFQYMEQRRRAPDPGAKLEACYRAVIDAMRKRQGGCGGLAIGGKSMGGRIATQVAAGGADVAGLVLLGYPLHPPGKPEQLRVKHLPAITAPMLIVQGARDAFGTPEELAPIIKKLKAPVRLHVVAGGDHSFKVPKKAGITPEQIHETILDETERWLRETIVRRETSRADR